MGAKINLNEELVVKEYLGGKSSIVLCKEFNVSKPKILSILKKHNVTKKRDRCKKLNIIKKEDKFIIKRDCPECNKKVIVSSNNPTITCRNYYDAINKKTLCKECALKNQLGEGNPFYGKKHTKESKEKISTSRKGKGTGVSNSMANPVHKKRAAQNLKKKWDDGEMEHVRKIMSDKIKETRRLGKLKSVIRSQTEKKILKEIKLLGYDVKHSLKVDGKIFDIFLPKLNLVIEYNGDYWHCNPKKYEPNYFHQVKNKTAKELWEYDKNKIDLIKEYGYNLEVVWESDYNTDKSIINKIIKKYDKR